MALRPPTLRALVTAYALQGTFALKVQFQQQKIGAVHPTSTALKDPLRPLMFHMATIPLPARTTRDQQSRFALAEASV